MKKVIIIGAGPAGLTAGYELLKKAPDEYSVTIYEESAAIGGISRTVNHNGNRMDIGGHRFFSKDKEVMNWWQEMMPRHGKPSFDDIQLGREKNLAEGGPDPEQTDRVMLVRNRVSRIYYKHKFFDYPVSLKWDTIKNMGFATTMEAGFSYLGSAVVKKEESSLENFYINRFGKKLYSMFFEGYTEKLWGRHPSEISADWGAQRVKGLSILAVIKDMFTKVTGISDGKVETSLIEEFYYPKYGPGQLWETTAKEFEALGGQIVMNAKVTKINTNGTDAVKSITVEQDGSTSEVSGDIFFSSMPVKDLVAGMNDVPENEARIAAGLPYRDFVTVGLLMNRLELKNETKIRTLGNIVPDCWIYVQDTGVKMGRIQIFNNWSPYMVKHPDKRVWVGLEYFCAEGDKFWNLTEDQTIRFAIAELKKMGVINEDTKIYDGHRERVKKAYPAYFDTYDEIDTLIEYLNRFGNLWCVGRNGQHRYNNMDHSMATSFEAVKNILAGTTDKTNVWNVNTEQEYHETASAEEIGEDDEFDVLPGETQDES
ncbi:MAG: NAD(P)/FAD-dependent oxidoreductase [Oscillospiraceae bacterium]|nr:NAD(P)/FAD-dependent oxidoreductase [Oscillospiraceae bacterium]